MAYAEIGNPAFDLVACGGQTAGRGLAPRWPPTAASGWPLRAVFAGLAAPLLGGLSSLTLTAEFLHAGSNGSEVVSTQGRFTAVPPSACLVLTAAQEPCRRAEANMVNI